MYYLIETSKEGRKRLIRRSRLKYAMDSVKAVLSAERTVSVHKFKNSTDVMDFIQEHNKSFPLTRFTSMPALVEPAAATR